MDYKQLIRSRSLRRKLLELISFVPDKPMLQLQYRMKFGRRLNLKKPERFTEKMQWYKLYYRDPEMVRCVDKFDVRAYLQERGFGALLNQCYGVFDSPEDLDIDKLPSAFALKDTLGGGGNDILLVPDKSALDIAAAKKTMQAWCDTPLVPSGGREWPYYVGKKHRIYAEEYLDVPEGLIEYKFFCFYGKAAFLYVIADRKLGQGGKFHILNPDFSPTGVIRVGDEPGDFVPEKPECFAKMLDIAQKMAEPFPHVRVDLFVYRGQIRFGELTFYNASGYMQYAPDSFDTEIGERFILPERNRG